MSEDNVAVTLDELKVMMNATLGTEADRLGLSEDELFAILALDEAARRMKALQAVVIEGRAVVKFRGAETLDGRLDVGAYGFVFDGDDAPRWAPLTISAKSTS